MVMDVKQKHDRNACRRNQTAGTRLCRCGLNSDTNHCLHWPDAISLILCCLHFALSTRQCWYRVYNVAKQEAPCQHASLFGRLTVSTLPTDIAKTSLSSVSLPSTAIMFVTLFCSCRLDICRTDDSRKHGLPSRILLDTNCRMYSWGIAMPTYTVRRDFDPCLSQYRR